MLFDTSTCSAQAELTTNGINKVPFVLSELFTRKLKGGVEKQGRDSVGWLLPPQLWGKVGMGVSFQASPRSQPPFSLGQ